MQKEVEAAIERHSGKLNMEAKQMEDRRKKEVGIFIHQCLYF